MTTAEPAATETRQDWTLDGVAREAVEVKLQTDETFVEGVNAS